MIGALLLLSAQGIVLVKPAVHEAWRPVIERFIHSTELGEPVQPDDFVRPMNPQGAALLHSLSGCRQKGYDSTFDYGVVEVGWYCKGRHGPDHLMTFLTFQGDKIAEISVREDPDYDGYF